jgi:UDPglucose--hexose-1-phosphate uridylyltransferase
MKGSEAGSEQKQTEKAIREIRINPVVPSESVLVATARSMRPKQAEQAAPRDTRHHVETCPFCSGNEQMTPPQIATYPNDENWEIRIVENLYPVLGDDQPGSSDFSFGLQQTIDGYGRHEVIIDHNNHGISIHEMSPEHLAMLFGAYRDRIIQLYESDDRLRYVLVFKNFGPAAGGSIPHTHSQIIATPVIPENVQSEITHSGAYFDKHHRCIFCSLIDEALTFEATIYDRQSGEVRRRLDVGQYVVERTENFIAIKPFASRYEWEVHIYPLHHQADFQDVTNDQLLEMGGLLQRTMGRLDAVLGGVQYNYFMHSLPRGVPESTRESYHWHLEICPRTSIPTGFELGSGLFVNTVSPEEAAKRLREAQLETT